MENMNQDSIFQKTEGDNWFERNLKLLQNRDPASDFPLAMLARHKLRPKRVLEVGASFGWRLSEIRKKYHAYCLGIEPSRKAIAFGQSHYPGISFRKGLMHDLPVRKNETFDLIIVAFVFHWVDRSTLLSSVSEIDRCLAEGGHLIIADFLPNRPTRKPYHHLPKGRVFTYKQDYAKLFLSSCLYREKERVLFHHATLRSHKDVPSDERAICVLLQKQLQYAKHTTNE